MPHAFVMRSSWRLTAAICLSYAAGFIGFLFVGSNLANWYVYLEKPALTPPDWIFSPVWVVLYALMGIALGLVWMRSAAWHPWIGCFLVSLAFNAAWMMFFFFYHALLVAFIDVLFLSFIIIALMLGAWPIERRATYLLAPYLAWTLFATYLNGAIWYLNG